MVEDGMAFSAWGGASAAPSLLQEGQAASFSNGVVQGGVPQLEGAMPNQQVAQAQAQALAQAHAQAQAQQQAQWWPPAALPAQTQLPATNPWAASGHAAPVQPAHASWPPAQPQAGNVSDRNTSPADPGAAGWAYGGYPAPATSGSTPAAGEPAPAPPSEASGASWAGKGGSREQAAWALWYQHWASQAAQMGNQQYGWPTQAAMMGYGAPAPAYGVPPPPSSAPVPAEGAQPQAPGWPAPPQAAAPWPGWGEAPPWPPLGNGSGPATATSAPSTSLPQGRPESPISLSTAVAAGDAAAQTHGKQMQVADLGNSAVENTDGPASEPSHQMKGSDLADDTEHTVGDLEIAAVNPEDRDLCEDISSAVALFLAGEDDGFDSDDERGNNYSKTDQPASEPVALPSASPEEAETPAAAPPVAAPAMPPISAPPEAPPPEAPSAEAPPAEEEVPPLSEAQLASLPWKSLRAVPLGDGTHGQTWTVKQSQTALARKEAKEARKLIPEMPGALPLPPGLVAAGDMDVQFPHQHQPSPSGPAAGVATPPEADLSAVASISNGTPPKTSAPVAHGHPKSDAAASDSNGTPPKTSASAYGRMAQPAVADAKPKHLATVAGRGTVANHPQEPTAAGVQDFLNVLRKRSLPADITEEKRQLINKLFFSCVMSLYRDRIKPVLNVLQRRLRECKVCDSGVCAVLPLCAREPETYKIMPPIGGQQPVILFAEEPPWFNGWVDVECQESNFGPDVWQAFHGFLRAEDAVLPSNAYQAAMELRARFLPHLSKLCLGELEHLVRQAIGRNLLKHHGDSLKPVHVARQLEAAIKERRTRHLKVDIDFTKGKAAGGATTGGAATGGAATGGAAVTLPEVSAPGDITDGDDLTVVLLQLMQRFPNGVALSLMKHYVQSYCKRNLNEAHFKCSKLAEVFKLSPLNQIFPLETRSRSEIIVKPPKPNAIPVHIWQKFYHLRDTTGAVPLDIPPDAAACDISPGAESAPAKKAPPPPPPAPPAPPAPGLPTPASGGSLDANGLAAANAMRLQ